MAFQLVTIELDYTVTTRLKELTPEQFRSLTDRLPELGLPATQAEVPNYWTKTLVCGFQDVAFLADLGISARVSRVRGLMDERLPTLGKPDTGVNITNISIPNAGLFAVKKLKVLENECTEYVDEWLAKGWRIVAVCPPNDTRRPTYVMGSMEDRDHD